MSSLVAARSSLISLAVVVGVALAAGCQGRKEGAGNHEPGSEAGTADASSKSEPVTSAAATPSASSAPTTPITSAVAAAKAGVPADRIRAAVEGALDEEVVLRILRMNRKRYADCYAEATKKSPDLEGTTLVTFTVSGGKVSGIEFVGNLADDGLHACLKKAIGTLGFPPGGATSVAYPLSLSPD